jgi:hypothetical protein
MKLSEYVKQQLNEDDDDNMAVAGADSTSAGEPSAPNAGAGEQPPEQSNEEIGKVVYTVEAVDREDKIKHLLDYIMGIGNQKRSFDIVVAPGDDEIEKKFTWNGEATDKIKSVKAAKEGEEGDGGEGGEGGTPSTPPEDEAAAAAATGQ